MLREMDGRRSSFLIGSRTRTNVLKGKKVRQQDDGTDNFADYWTDSNEEDTSNTDNDYYSELSEVQKVPKVSEIRQKSSRQNVRTIQSSNILHSESKDNDKHTKILTSSKHFKNKISDYDENINSPTEKQKVSSKLQEGECQNSTVGVNILHSETKDKNKPSNSQILISSFKSFKNYNTNSLRDSVTKKASPLLPKSKENQEKLVSPKKSLVLRNLNETISLPSDSVCHDSSTCSLSPVLKESNERKKIFAVKKNASQAHFDTSGIHILSPVKVTDINLTNATESKSLVDETPNEKNSHIEHRGDSTIFKSSCRNHTNKTFTKYDDYDAEIMGKILEHERSLERLTKEQSSLLSSPKPSEKSKELNNSKSDPEYEESNAVTQKKKDGILKNHRKSKCVSNRVLSRSQQKNYESRDKSNIELLKERSVSQNFYNEKEKTHKKVKASEAFSAKNTENSADIPANANKNSQHPSSKKKKHINKIPKISKSAKSFLEDSAKSTIDITATEISQNFNNENDKHANDTYNNLAMFLSENTKSTANVPAKERSSMQKLHIQRQTPVNKTYEKLKTSKTLSDNNEIINAEINKADTFNFRSGKNITAKNKKKRKASETIEVNQKTDNCLKAETETTSIHKKKKKQTSECHQDLSYKDNDQQVSSKEKMANKMHSTDGNAPHRRSVRQKLPPLENSHNERLLYPIEHGITDATGIDNNTSKDEIYEGEGENVSDINDDTHESHVSDTEDNELLRCHKSKENSRNSMQNLHIQRKISVNKIYEKLKTSKTLSDDNEIINAEINIEGTSNFRRGNKKKQKASETIEENQNTDNFLEAQTETTSVYKKRKKQVSECHPDLSSKKNNDQQVSFHQKKKRNKRHSIYSNVPLRRSVRQKFPRLERWRNERLIYKIENGIPGVVGIDPGGIDPGYEEREKPLPEVKKKKEVKQTVIKRCVYDGVNGQTVRIPVKKSFDAVPWDKEFNGKEHPYRIKRIFETETAVTGFIQIEPNQEKPMQYMPTDDIFLTVIRGKVEVNLGKIVEHGEEKCMFVVPRCVPYSIKNVGTVKAALTFCVGKFHYIETH